MTVITTQHNVCGAGTLDELRTEVERLGLKTMDWAGAFIFGPCPNGCFIAVRITPDMQWVPWGHIDELAPERRESLLQLMLWYRTLDQEERPAEVDRYRRLFGDKTEEMEIFHAAELLKLGAEDEASRRGQ